MDAYRMSITWINVTEGDCEFRQATQAVADSGWKCSRICEPQVVYLPPASFSRPNILATPIPSRKNASMEADLLA